MYLDTSKMSDTRQHDALISKVQKHSVQEGSLEGGAELIKNKKQQKPTFTHLAVTFQIQKEMKPSNGLYLLFNILIYNWDGRKENTDIMCGE